MLTTTIGGIDVTNYIDWTSVRIENILTQQVDKCSFIIRSFGGKNYKPVVGRVITIVDSGTTIFGGVVSRVTESSRANNILEHEVECLDFTRLLDQHLVARVYENMTVNAIIADIVASFCPAGITATQVVCPLVVNYVQFKYEPVSYCLKQLADLVGYDWYIDYTKDIYFKAPSATPAPIEITDDGGVYDVDSLVIRRDNSQVRNSIVVRGGKYLGTEFTATGKADGQNITFLLPYQYSDFKIRVNGVKQTVGIDNIDDPLSFDALYNFDEKVVRWRSDNKPGLNATLSFSGKPYLPVIVQLTDPSAVQAIYSAEGIGDGKYEYLVIDKSINSKQGARDRAAAEIASYGETLSEGEFTTETAGLRAGQQLRVNSASRGMDEYFIINKVVSVMKTPTTVKYKISLVTTKTMDFISVMKKLLFAETKKIEIDSTELLDLVIAPGEVVSILDSVIASMVHNPLTETSTMSETFSAQSLNFGVQFVAGPQTPSGVKRVFIVEGSQLG